MVTLREIEAAGILLNSRMGYNAQEHDEMLDDKSLFRLAISPDWVELQVYQQRPFRKPEWENPVAYPVLASGHSMACRAEGINRSIRSLVK